LIVVTGGAGFIGSALVRRLNQKGQDRILVVDQLGTGSKWKNLVKARFLDYIPKQRFLELFLKNGLAGIEAIFHLGACSDTGQADADYLYANNFVYSRRLAEKALAEGIRFIHASSAATYGDGGNGFSDDENDLVRLRPLNMYAFSKHLFDLWARRRNHFSGLVSLKFFNVFGPNEYHKGAMRSVVLKAFEQVRRKGRVELFKSYRPQVADGEQRRDFIYVKDCTEVMCRLLERPEINGVFNLGSGRSRTWNALARAVFRAMGQEEKIVYIDMPPQFREHYQYYTQAEMEKLKSSGCQVACRQLEEAVEDYIQGYLNTDDPYL